MYLLVASYHDVDRAEAHYEVLRSFRDVGRLGAYEAVILVRRADGGLEAAKAEEPTRFGVEVWEELDVVEVDDAVGQAVLVVQADHGDADMIEEATAGAQARVVQR